MSSLLGSRFVSFILCRRATRYPSTLISPILLQWHQKPSHFPSKNLLTHPQLLVGKTTKFNDRHHAAIADGTEVAIEHLPRYFAKSGHIDTPPNKIKKNGAGKGGW
jgi:hypothetical protein